MSIFITGAGGFVGRNFLEHLIGLQGVSPSEITCLVRAPLEKPWLGQTGVRVLEGDIMVPETYLSALKDVETVFHIAARVSLKNGKVFYPVNTEATRSMVSLLQQYSSRLKRLVYVSSIAAFDRDWSEPFRGPLSEASRPHPNTDYGKSKRFAEEAILQSGLPYTILRPAYIYGPHPRPNSSMDKVIHWCNTAKPVTRFPFPGEISEIHVSDLANAMWLTSESPAAKNQDYFIAHEEPVSLSHFFETIYQALGKPYEPLPIPGWGVNAARVLSRFSQDPVHRIIFEPYFTCSPRKLMNQTGWPPKYSLTEGLDQTVGWYRKQGAL